MRIVSLTALLCVQALLSPPMMNSGLAASALTNYPIQDTSPNRGTALVPAKSVSTPKLPSVPDLNTSFKKLPKTLVQQWVPADLSFKTDALSKAPVDQSLVQSNTYIEVLIRDSKNSRAVEQTRGVLRLGSKQNLIDGHFDAKALARDLVRRNLENLQIIVSVRAYEWFGRGERLGSISIGLKTLLEQLHAQTSMSFELPQTKTKITFGFHK